MKLQRIILSRTDHIGDVVLALPMAGMLKERLPSSSILFLGRSYTRAVVECCEHVDEFLNWDEVDGRETGTQVDFLKQLEADAIVHVFPRRSIAIAARKAGIATRVGHGRRAWGFLNSNRRVFFSRRESGLHEAQLNLKLLRPFGIRSVPTLEALPAYYGMTRVPPLRDDLAAFLASDRVNVVLHPKTQGNAKEWGIENFADLIDLLPGDRYRIFVTGTEDDVVAIGHGLPLQRPNVTSLLGALSLEDLIAFISRTDALVAASTGPLHVAAALGRHAIGLYSPRRAKDPGRWGPIGKNARAIVFDPECERCGQKLDCDCIREIPPPAVFEILREVEVRSRSDSQAS